MLNAVQNTDDEPIADEDAVTVSVSRATLMVLVMAADLLREHAKVIIESTPAIVGIDTLDVLSETGLIDPETLETTQVFDLACALGGIALGLGGSGGDEPPSDDGEGVDGLAQPDNDDYEGDVDAAERGFLESLPDAGRRLPAAASFGGD